MTDVLVITGLSGAGRSEAAADLEDLGWYVVDNLPTELVPRIADLAAQPGSRIDRLALVVGSNPQQADILSAVAALRTSGHRVRILFLEADTAELVRRYTSSRRKHPIGGASVLEAIERERGLLEAVKEGSDLVVDTTGVTVHQLKARLVEMFGSEQAGGGLQVGVVSFGFKHGLPLDADLVFDVRFLPNPHWDEALRPLNGKDDPVRRFVLERRTTQQVLDQIEDLLTTLLPAYAEEGKSYLTIAIGCTGGRHRSVAVSEELARRLRRLGYEPRVEHRDLPAHG